MPRNLMDLHAISRISKANENSTRGKISILNTKVKIILSQNFTNPKFVKSADATDTQQRSVAHQST